MEKNVYQKWSNFFCLFFNTALSLKSLPSLFHRAAHGKHHFQKEVGQRLPGRGVLARKDRKSKVKNFLFPLSRCWTRPNSVSANEIPPPLDISASRQDSVALPRRPLAHSNTRKERGVWGAVAGRSRLGVNYAAAAHSKVSHSAAPPIWDDYLSCTGPTPAPVRVRCRQGGGGAMICAAGLFVGFVCRERGRLCWLLLLS